MSRAWQSRTPTHRVRRAGDGKAIAGMRHSIIPRLALASHSARYVGPRSTSAPSVGILNNGPRSAAPPSGVHRWARAF